MRACAHDDWRRANTLCFWSINFLHNQASRTEQTLPRKETIANVPSIAVMHNYGI